MSEHDEHGLRVQGWAPIGSYGLLSDLDATALVAADGAIDWWAAPHMDSAPVCAALLDPCHGGAITLAPSVPFQVSRRYLPGTLVLETTFATAAGTVRVTDSLNRGTIGTLPWTELARRVDGLTGTVPMAWTVAPGHALADARPWAWCDDGIGRLAAGPAQLALVTDRVGDPQAGTHRVSGAFTTEPGQRGLLAVVASHGTPVFVPAPAQVCDRAEKTIEDWARWSSQVHLPGRWQQLAVRSALTIKALTSEATGGIAAAATTSLPEKIGGRRNYDYRYAWIRDSSFAIDAMHRLGLCEEVHGSLDFLIRAAAQRSPDLRPFYTMNATVPPATMRAVHAPGYHGSTPVHVGNQAADQTQLGCYGDLLDAIYGHVRAGGRLDPDTADMVTDLAERTCQLWPTPDAGFWELNDPQHYTISKIGCWVALDRAVKLADTGQLASLRTDRWRAERDQIHHWVDTHCWSEDKQAYTFHADTDDLDAACLLAARTGFCPAGDPRLTSTIDAVRAELGADGCLLYRYSGQRDAEGAFLACSGWLIEALVHAGRHEEATELLTDLDARATDLGLYSEEIDPATGHLLGNTPQVLTHLAVIGAVTAVCGYRPHR
ncbi:MAG TPA: glycoside hydrolase family 15 protein [Mycobacteriales bacterium]|nr:glycoside hydrolase family 15 protein [Mycobacteriales bacterium]